MKLLTFAFVIQFIIACWPKIDIITKVKQQYGRKTLTLVRKIEKTFLKLKKVELDLDFLKQCKIKNLIPKFCKLKPANNRGLSLKDLQSLKQKVLNLEIQVKNKMRSQLGRTYRQLQSTIKSEVSLLTYVSILQLLRSSSIKQTDSVKVRHATKLSNLQHSPNTDVYFLEADKIVVNLSNVKLSDTEVSVLSRGLNFSTPSQHLDCLDVRTSFECFYRQFYNNVPNRCISRLKQCLKGLCYNYIYGYRPNQFYNLSKEEFQSLQNLKKRKDIVFCKPDKGQGVVVLNRQDYANKLLNILNDKDIFKLLEEDPTERRESSLQRYLRYLKNLGAIT